MAQPKAVLLLAISLCLTISLSPRTLATEVGKPLLTAVTKDPATLLYTAPLKDSRPLVLDLAGPLIWSTCDAPHSTFECHHHECAHAHRYHPPSVQHTGYGKPDEEDRSRCKCTAHPHNPFSGKTETGDLTRTTLSANATDGMNPLHPVSFSAVTSCAPDSLLANLPAGAVGVAGLASSRLALPAQVARAQQVASKFLLCLPRRETEGVAIFGDSPFFTAPSGPVDLTSSLAFTSLHTKLNSPAHYISAKAIAVGKALVLLPVDALATGGVVFSTRAPYTALRPDVYRPVVDAFDKASGWNDLKVPAVPPFELCYDARRLPNTIIGRLAPDIDLMLGDGKNYSFGSFESMVEVQQPRVSCFAFVEMNVEKGGYGAAPIMEIGGFQMENNLLQFDLEKMRLGFAKVPFWTACTLFNFTQVAH